MEYCEGSIGKNGKTVEASFVNSSVPGTKDIGMVVPTGALTLNSMVKRMVPLGKDISES